MEIQSVSEAKELLAASRKVMTDALNSPRWRRDGVEQFDEQAREAAEVLARRLNIDDSLGQALIDELGVK